MIPEGTLISVQLPDREGEVLARVIKCSTQGRSCTLELEHSEEPINVNISKCNYNIVEEAAAADEDPSDNSDDEDAEEEPELDVFRELNVDSSALDRLVAADASELLQKSEDIANAARRAAKDLLEYSAKLQEASAQHNINGIELTSISEAPPSQPALYVEGFDPEQIWLQLDMLSGPALKRVRKQIKNAEEIEYLVPPEIEEALDQLLGLDDDEEESDLSEEEDTEGSDEDEYEEEEDGLDYEAMLETGNGGRDESEEEEELEEDGSSEEEVEEAAAALGGRKRRRMTDAEARAAVEDDFMKLDEMEAFLQQAERKAAGEDDEDPFNQQDGDDQIESDSDIDDAALGKEGGSTDEDDSDAEEAELEALLDNAAGLVGRKRKKADGKNKKKKVKFSGLSDSEEDSEDEEDVDLAEDPLANATYEDFFGPRKGAKTGGVKKSSSAVAAKPKQRSVLAEDPDSSEEDDYLNDDDDDDDDMYDQQQEESEEEDDNSTDAELDEEKRASKHQRRLEKTASRIRKLEEEAMAEKPWWLQGEVVAGSRPKNSALEIDLDFETTVKPPPAPTEETTRSLEDLIKSRIVDGRFDDPLKFVPPPPDKAKTVVELDDKKSTKGLGELYEQDYVAAVTGVVDDRDAPVRELAQAQFKALSAALDALSHGHYRPVPSIEEVTVKVDVPAIMMEEAAPAFVSAASMRAPEEVYKAGTGAITVGDGAAGGEGEEGGAQGLRMVLQSGGGFKSEAELTKEDRKRRRAGKKRASKKKKAAKEEELAARAAAKGEVRVSGRKSEEEQQQLRKLAAKTKKQGANAPSNYSKSAQVFGQLQAQREGGGIGPAAEEPRTVRASGLKL